MQRNLIIEEKKENGDFQKVFISNQSFSIAFPLLNPKHSPPQPVGLRNCTAAAFASFKKFATHFLNADFVVTEPNEAAYAVTGFNSRHEL